MNKITHKPDLHVEYINLNKAETDSFRHQMIMKTSQLLTKQLSTSSIHPDPVPEAQSDQKSIFIKKQALQRTLSVYQWRHKTCYPVIKPTKLIIKSFTGNIKQRRPLCKKNAQSPFQIWNLDESLYELIVVTEKVNHRLSEISSLPLPQLFYLLKQVLVGFQCLIDIFGIFEPTQEMIAINEQNEWRFWISEDFASNSKKESNFTEAEFILKIVKMVESRLTNSKVGAKFFEELKNLSLRSFTFLNILDMANIFISFNKIIVAKKFVSSQTSNSKSLYGSKNQSYFKLNRTYNELKDSGKNPNDKTFTKVNIESSSPQKPSLGINKISTMKNLNDKGWYSKKDSGILNSSNRMNDNKKQKESKAHLKISQFYYPENLSKANNIEKRTSFLFSSGELVQKPKESFLKNKTSLDQIQRPESSLSFKPQNNTKTQNFIDSPTKFRPMSPRSPKARKIQPQNIVKTQPIIPITSQPINNYSPASPKQRKNSFYNYERPNNKEAFSQSPNKSSSKNVFFSDERKKQYNENNKINNQRRDNIIMQQEPTSRSRKYSESGPQIKSLDQFAKKSKKMFESSTMEAAQPHKDVKYCNLKSKDIACHVRHATIAGMAFGQSPKKVQRHVSKNIRNDVHNGKFEQIMKSVKSRSNGDKNQENDDVPQSELPARKRRITLFDQVRQVPERLVSEQFEQQQAKFKQQYSPYSASVKPIIRVSNANNLTAESLNKSSNIAKGSQSNSHSNNNKKSNIRESDTNSNQREHYRGQERRGMIGQSNLSVFSCKTYQPGKEGDKKFGVKERERNMVNSQDCFNNNNQSESSQEFLKNNNWNKKISGLFSEVPSIKMLKESSHFGDEFEMFQKDHLKDVKLDKLDKLGKQLKGSIIQMDDGRRILNIPTRGGLHNKSFSLIGQVKQQPYQNDPSYLQYSTSMICQSRNMQMQYNRMDVMGVEDVQRNIKQCESFEEDDDGDENEKSEVKEGFNFMKEFYKFNVNSC